jgi:hypothetical protein
MKNYYNTDVNDLMDMDRTKNKISLNDIYAQIYNVSNASARSMVNKYIIDRDQRLADKGKNDTNPN